MVSDINKYITKPGIELKPGDHFYYNLEEPRELFKVWSVENGIFNLSNLTTGQTNISAGFSDDLVYLLVPNKFTVKDSGVRESYESGMRRDTQEGKPNFSLVMPEAVPYEEQLFTRLAQHMTLGAVKYGDRNWEVANSPEELNRFKSSAIRHFMQWYHGEIDEDHFSAAIFNMQAAEFVKGRLSGKW